VEARTARQVPFCEQEGDKWKVWASIAVLLEIVGFSFHFELSTFHWIFRNKKALGVAEGLEISVNRYYAATPGN
jgi:hypothetical protein